MALGPTIRSINPLIADLSEATSLRLDEILNLE